MNNHHDISHKIDSNVDMNRLSEVSKVDEFAQKNSKVPSDTVEFFHNRHRNLDKNYTGIRNDCPSGDYSENIDMRDNNSALSNFDYSDKNDNNDNSETQQLRNRYNPCDIDSCQNQTQVGGFEQNFDSSSDNTNDMSSSLEHMNCASKEAYRDWSHDGHTSNLVTPKKVSTKKNSSLFKDTSCFMAPVLRETTTRQPMIDLPVSSPPLFRGSPIKFNFTKDWLINYLQGTTLQGEELHETVSTSNLITNHRATHQNTNGANLGKGVDTLPTINTAIQGFSSAYCDKLNLNNMDPDSFDRPSSPFTPEIQIYSPTTSIPKESTRQIEIEYNTNIHIKNDHSGPRDPILQRLNSNPKDYNTFYRNNFMDEVISPIEDSYVTTTYCTSNVTVVDTYLKLQIVTWNMQGKSAPSKEAIAKFVRNPNSQHLYIFGAQECERSIASSILFRSKDNWESTLKELLGDSYQVVGSSTLVATHCVVFAHKSILPHISNVVTSEVATGFLNGSIGNKGCAAVSLKIEGISFMFICCHLAAHQENVEQRNSSYYKIIKEVEYSGKSKVEGNGSIFKDLDYIFLFGDLNYRINGSKKQVEQLLEANNQEVLLSNDQVHLVRQLKQALSEFEEGAILFRPTYKFSSQNTEEYESKKNRVPSWTDRIFYYSRHNEHSEGSTMSDNSTFSENSTCSDNIEPSHSTRGMECETTMKDLHFKLKNTSLDALEPEGSVTSYKGNVTITHPLPQIKLLEYDSVDVRYSDHRPVLGRFLCKMEDIEIKREKIRNASKYAPSVSSAVCNIQ